MALKKVAGLRNRELRDLQKKANIYAVVGVAAVVLVLVSVRSIQQYLL